MKTKSCPRCKEERLIDWFGDRNAPYAICLSCRVELNGEKKKKKNERRLELKRANCAICEMPLIEKSEICIRCKGGLEAFKNDQRLIGRAASYAAGKLRRSHRKPKKFKVRDDRLRRLINDQWRDANDRYSRFDHAISK